MKKSIFEKNLIEFVIWYEEGNHVSKKEAREVVNRFIKEKNFKKLKKVL